MGASRSLLATSTALMIRMVFVDPDPGFQPVMMMTGSPFWINPRSIPLWIPLYILLSTSTVHSLMTESERCNQAMVNGASMQQMLNLKLQVQELLFLEDFRKS